MTFEKVKERLENDIDKIKEKYNVEYAGYNV